jgi:hypothetical protein
MSFLDMTQGPLANQPGAGAGIAPGQGMMPTVPSAMGGPQIGNMGAGQFGGAMGDAIGGLFPNQQNPNMGSENAMRSNLAQFMAMNPSKISRTAGQQDIWKSMWEGSNRQKAMDPAAWNNLGSTNPNLLGQNAGIEDFIKMAGLEKPKSGGIFSKILKFAPMALNFVPGIGTAAFLAINAATQAASKAAQAKGW